MKLKAIIIDDEIKGAKSLEILLNSINSEVEVKEIALNALDGIKAIKKHQPDILFLDINMPVHSGFEVLDHIERDSLFVVFTTAHEEYAINAIRQYAFDYLLKPIDPEELSDCVNRIKMKLAGDAQTKSSTNKPIEAELKINLTIPVKEGLLILKQEKIIRIEGSGSYSYIFLDGNEKHIVSKSLKEIEGQLDENLFFRCHNSHIIHLGKVNRFIRTDGNFVEMSDRSKAEVSRAKKDILLSKIA